MGRKVDHPAVEFAGDGAVKITKRLQKHFSALIGFDQDYKRAAQFGEGQRDDQGFGRIGEAGEAHFARALAQGFEGFIGYGATRHPRQKLADDGQNHAGSCLMRSRRREVEKPGSSGMRITLAPEARAASSSRNSFWLEVSSPPLATTSGASRAINSRAVGSSYWVT